MGRLPPLSVMTEAFPCWAVDLTGPVEDVTATAQAFLALRPSENWLLLNADAVVSDAQLWTAWLGLCSREKAGTIRARSRDAEFIRLIAGTHQIRIGFERAGLRTGDTTAWLLHLPPCPEGELVESDWPASTENPDFLGDFATRSHARPEGDGEAERRALAEIALADLR